MIGRPSWVLTDQLHRERFRLSRISKVGSPSPIKPPQVRRSISGPLSPFSVPVCRGPSLGTSGLVLDVRDTVSFQQVRNEAQGSWLERHMQTPCEPKSDSQFQLDSGIETTLKWGIVSENLPAAGSSQKSGSQRQVRYMPTPKLDGRALLRTSARLGDAVVDPNVWPQILHEISSAVGAVGAALLQSDVRTPDIPRTEAVHDVFDLYFREGWHTRDIRAERGVPLLLGGQRVVMDQDILTADEIGRSDYYQELLAPHRLGWWAVIGFQAGPAHWGLSIQRSIQQGPFVEEDRRILAQLADRLTETATLSTAVGRIVLSGMTNALELLKQPALALDRFGCVLDFNAAAEQMFNRDVRVRNRCLELSDRQARSNFDTFIERLRTGTEGAALSTAPIVVRRSSKRPLLLRVLPVDGAARSPFLGARALLVFSDLHSEAGLNPKLLSHIFGLSPAEARLAAVLANGLSPEQAARK